MNIPHPLVGLLLCASLVGVSAAVNAATATKIEIIATNKSEEVGEVSVTWDDGKSERLTKGNGSRTRRYASRIPTR